MPQIFLITVMALTAVTTAAPYISPLSGFSAYSPAFTSPIIPGAIPAAYPAAYSALSAAYPRADLAAYAFGDYSYGFRVPNYASAYSLPYMYEYIYGR